MAKFKLKFTKIQTKDYLKNYCFKEKFLEICADCGRFGSNYACPPYGFETTEYIKGYQHTYLIGAKIDLNPEEVAKLTDQQTKFAYGRQVIKAMRELLDGKLLRLEAKYPDSRGFFAGSCMGCEECNRAYGEACVDIDRVRYSLEAFGFDMGKTAEELLDLKIMWSDDYLPPYYILISGFCTNQLIDGFDDVFVAS